MTAPAHLQDPSSTPAGDRPRLLGLDRRGVLVGAGLVAVLLVLVYVGSGALRWFDSALAGYLMGTLLATFAVAYRYVVWVERPPTRRLRDRGWQAFWGSGARLRNVLRLPDVLWGRLVGQGLQARRVRRRIRVPRPPRVLRLPPMRHQASGDRSCSAARPHRTAHHVPPLRAPGRSCRPCSPCRRSPRSGRHR